METAYLIIFQFYDGITVSFDMRNMVCWNIILLMLLNETLFQLTSVVTGIFLNCNTTTKKLRADCFAHSKLITLDKEKNEENKYIN